MRKIVLGANPKNFKRSVEVTLPDGEKAEIQVSFIYRTRTGMAEFLEKMNAKIEEDANGDKQLTFVEHLRKSVEEDADNLMEIIDGWNLEAEFTRDNVVKFCDELPDALRDIVQAYMYGGNAVREKKLTDVGSALFEKDPTLELRAAGLEPEDYAEMFTDIEVFQENQLPVKIFRMVLGQWRFRDASAIGLDYNVVFRLLDRYAGAEWDNTFDAIRILENSALEAISRG